jgi:hypothetical protein
MHYTANNRAVNSTLLLLFTLIWNFAEAQTGRPALAWKVREDLNITLPASVRVYETNGFLKDSARVRAMYATVDLRDENLKLHAVGDNTKRETTQATSERRGAILAINGGYFSSKKSESILISEGKLVAPGPTRFTRGAFGLQHGKPQIVWAFCADSTSGVFVVPDPTEITPDQDKLQITKSLSPWDPAEAIGGGPVLVKDGKIRDTSHEEGFGESHLKRHPRTAIGYINEYTLVLMVVDGRQQSSAGVTIEELAQIMFEAGCYEAVNLDGGGSSAMIAANEIVNVPVDKANGNQHSLRKNASALVITEAVPSSKANIVIIDTDSKNFEEQGVWSNTSAVNYYGDTPSREAASTKGHKVIYRFNGIHTGHFQLATWWTVNENNTKRATYLLHRGHKIDSIQVDQTLITSNGRWNVIGNYKIRSSDYLEVIGNGDQKNLVADAIRLIRIERYKKSKRRR